MSLKDLKLHKTFTVVTTNDTVVSSYCSCCHNFSPLIKLKKETSKRNCVCYRNNAVKNFRQPNISFYKFLLIYSLTIAAFTLPITCTQHQDMPIRSALAQVIPSSSSSSSSSSNNIAATLNYSREKSPENESSEYNDYDLDEKETEEDEDPNYSAQSSPEVKKMYEQQNEKYFKKLPFRSETENTHATTMRPRSSTEGSCVSNACQNRKTIEEASTESIRKQILMKLGMEHEPNKTKYPPLPDEFREQLCKTFNISPENCFGRKASNVEYQSDDPVDLQLDEYESKQDVIAEEEDVQFLSFENRIYAFPSTTIKPRHKSHLIFQFTESQEMNNIVAQATLNLFVHDRKFLDASEHAFDQQIPKNITFVDIEIAKVLQSSQHKRIFETFRNISLPAKGSNGGGFVQLNITEMVAEWFITQETSHGMAVKVYDTVTGAPLPHKFVSLDPKNFASRPFIDILPRNQRRKRTKRSSLQCSKGSSETRCCRHDLTVDFDKFGWDWIIAPKKYDANYCAGECKIAFMQKYAHTHVMTLSTAANPCCSPRKMTAMQLLYFDSQLNIVLGTIPNMIVEECFCS